MQQAIQDTLASSAFSVPCNKSPRHVFPHSRLQPVPIYVFHRFVWKCSAVLVNILPWTIWRIQRSSAVVIVELDLIIASQFPDVLDRISSNLLAYVGRSR